MCENLTEISVYPQSESREIPVELIVTPTQFAAKLIPDQSSWRKLTSFFFHIPSHDEWHKLKTILPKMTNLSTLYLLIDAEDADPRVDDCVLREEVVLDSYMHLFSRLCVSVRWSVYASAMFGLKSPSGSLSVFGSRSRLDVYYRDVCHFTTSCVSFTADHPVGARRITRRQSFKGPSTARV